MVQLPSFVLISVLEVNGLLRAHGDAIPGESDQGTITQEAKFAPRPIWKIWSSSEYRCAALTLTGATAAQSCRPYIACSLHWLSYHLQVNK